MKYIYTVFTPTYNRANKLYRVYESIKKQKLQKIDDKYIFEWIIVDDGSSDNTKELVQKWKNESDFDIIYHFQKNRGKANASRTAIELARGELFLFADSDDEFMDDTFEVFYNIWSNFDEIEKEKCGGIGALCQDQYGKRIGCDYPIENRLVPTLKVVFGWKDIGLGETWAALKTKNLKRYFIIPYEAKNLNFIPESFFWSRITVEAKPDSYFINKVLRVYYVDENDNISNKIRQRHPEGFLFESKWFVYKYWWIFFKYPKIYLKHVIKYIFYTIKGKIYDTRENMGLFSK